MGDRAGSIPVIRSHKVVILKNQGLRLFCYISKRARREEKSLRVWDIVCIRGSLKKWKNLDDMMTDSVYVQV